MSGEYEYDNHFTNDGDRDFKPIDIFKGAEIPFDFEALTAESDARIAATASAGKPVLLTVEELAKIDEIRYLHDTALARALKRDGHSKSSEGNITIDIGNYWERSDGDKPEVGVNLYSYVLGPSRSHWFASIDRALETVRVWYAREMSSPAEYNWGDDGKEEFDSAMFDALAGKITIVEISEDPEEEHK
jgi:hypothetical protein